MMRTALFLAVSVVTATCVQAADKSVDARVALERKLYGHWKGPACGGNWAYAADGTFTAEQYTPAGIQLAGTWEVRWNALPPTLVRTCKTSDDPELIGKAWEVKLVHLEDDAFSYQSPDQYPKGHRERFTRREKAEDGDRRDVSPLRLSIHYLDGLSARSRETSQDIRFLHYGCHLSLLLTNTTKDEIHLWKPNCPEGDAAIRLEFKRDADSKEVGTARMVKVYTGGSGRPRTMKLVPGDALVYRVDLSSYWSLPFVLKPGAQANLFVRAVYESKPIASKKSPLAPHADKVWNGRIETDWERVHIVNLTDSEVPKGHRGVNILE